MSEQLFINIRRISKSFQSGRSQIEVLKNISIKFSPAKIIVINGESGAGKSTLLHLLGGLDRADAGEIIIGKYALERLNEIELARYRRQEVGFIFQFHYLLNDFTALENIMLPAVIGGVKKSIAREHAKKLLHAVGLTDRATHYPRQLSGGEQQRVAVARALINSPAVILADEPTGNLDEENSRTVEAMLFMLARRFGKTLIAATHDREMAQRADEHYLLAHGALHRQ